MSKILYKIEKTNTGIHDYPALDIAFCMDCKWKGKTRECIEYREGDWESGYCVVPACPECGTGELDFKASFKSKIVWWFYILLRRRL